MQIDLHAEAASNLEMGYLYEELIRRFSELSNETAGEHFTPREVIHLDGYLGSCPKPLTTVTDRSIGDRTVR